MSTPHAKLGCKSASFCKSGNAQSSGGGLSAGLKRSLCRMFATGSARPDKDGRKPVGGSKPAKGLQEKGSLIQAEERATGVFILSPTHGYPGPNLVLRSRAPCGSSLI